MGGGNFFSSPAPASENGSCQDLPEESINSIVSSADEKWVNGVEVLRPGEFPDAGRLSSVDEATERQRSKVYLEVLRSYGELPSRIDTLEEARNKILSYTPGSWADEAGGMDLSNYDIPDATSLLLIGPKGSGKSSLINNISRALEDDIPFSGRAQVSCNSSAENGTCFLHEYMIPRVAGSFCLYDTRGLSVDSSENLKAFKRWMRKGVCHGELVRRKSDTMTLKSQLKCKARRCFSFNRLTPVGFVIFVVNGVSVLESIDSADEKKKRYSQMIATNFNNPLLSFKDDKPVVVVTHGDLLPLSDRVRVRVHLGELLGIPPHTQIFDIPENNDPATRLAIVDLLNHCLNRADRNLPAKDWPVDQVNYLIELLIRMLVAVVFIFLVYKQLYTGQPQASDSPPPPSPVEIDWTKIRHMWYGD